MFVLSYSWAYVVAWVSYELIILHGDGLTKHTQRSIPHMILPNAT